MMASTRWQKMFHPCWSRLWDPKKKHRLRGRVEHWLCKLRRVTAHSGHGKLRDGWSLHEKASCKTACFKSLVFKHFFKNRNKRETYKVRTLFGNLCQTIIAIHYFLTSMAHGCDQKKADHGNILCRDHRAVPSGNMRCLFLFMFMVSHPVCFHVWDRNWQTSELNSVGNPSWKAVGHCTLHWSFGGNLACARRLVVADVWPTGKMTPRRATDWMHILFVQWGKTSTQILEYVPINIIW